MIMAKWIVIEKGASISKETNQICLYYMNTSHTSAKWRIPKLIQKACTISLISKLHFYILIGFNVFWKLHET